MKQTSVSRRKFLKLSAVTTTAALIAACAPSSPDADTGAGGASPSSEATEIEVTVSGWVDTAWKVTERTEGYNEMLGDATINVTASPEGWETKALSQIAEGEPGWHGHLTHHPFRVSVQWLSQGLIMPIDEFMSVSPNVDMDNYWSAMIAPDLLEFDCSVKGQQVGVPLGIDTCCQAFNAELMERAGLPHTREDFMAERSWDQIQDWAELLREEFKDENVWGISTWRVYHQSLGAIFQSITSDLYYDDGLIRFDSEEMQKALEIQARWSWSGAAPVPAWGQPDEAGDIFPGGRGALWQGQVGTVGAAQRAHGVEKIPYAMPVLVEEGGTGGNQWYTTCGYVLNKSRYPQEVVDFYTWMFGPDNDTNAELTLAFNWFPLFTKHWDQFVDGNPENEWAKDFVPQIENADLIPRNPYYEIEHTTAQKYCELAHAERLTVAEACQQMMDEIRQKVDDMEIEW